MRRPAHQVSHTFADYLSLEAMSNVKHEFLDGNIYAMAGGTPDNAALAAAASGLLFGQLQKSSCRVYDSDLRVRVLATGLATYPDSPSSAGHVSSTRRTGTRSPTPPSSSKS
jgi:Uma2 family endonuclease